MNCYSVFLISIAKIVQVALTAIGAGEKVRASNNEINQCSVASGSMIYHIGLKLAAVFLMHSRNTKV